MCNTPKELESAEDSFNAVGWANPITAPSWVANQALGIGDSFTDQFGPEQLSDSGGSSGGGGSGGVAMPGVPDELLDLYKAQTALAEFQTEIGKDQWNFYVENYRPVELKDIQSALAGLPADYYVDRASADVGQAFDEARGINMRNLSRSGVSLSGARAQGLEERLGLARSLADAGARNNTRMAVNEYNINRLSNVANRGMGLPTSAASIIGAGAGALGSVAGQQLSQYGTQVSSALNQAQLAESTRQFNENQQLQREIADQQAMTNFWGSIGSLGGNILGTALPFMF